MKITPIVTQQNGMILVTLQASFAGDSTDFVDKQNILAFGDPLVNLTGGQFVDNSVSPATPAQYVVQGILFKTTFTGRAGNSVEIQFVSEGSSDVDAITVSGSTGAMNLVTVDILPLTGPVRTTANIVSLFGTYPPDTSAGGNILASGGSGTAATTAGPFSFAGGAEQVGSTFTFAFPASDLFVGVTTQMAGYQARFMTQLQPAPVGSVPSDYNYCGDRHIDPPGSLDCVTSDPQHAANFWITTIEARISSLMTALRSRTVLGPQSSVTV